MTRRRGRTSSWCVSGHGRARSGVLSGCRRIAERVGGPQSSADQRWMAVDADRPVVEDRGVMSGSPAPLSTRGIVRRYYGVWLAYALAGGFLGGVYPLF